MHHVGFTVLMYGGVLKVYYKSNKSFLFQLPLSFSLANVNIYSKISNTVTRMSCQYTNYLQTIEHNLSLLALITYYPHFIEPAATLLT
jgi:hypothetical protein